MNYAKIKKGCLIGLITVVILFVIVIILFVISFMPRHKTVKIKQDIGGVLICHSIYNADHHSWQYNVDYEYQLNDSLKIKIGDGVYYGREWKQDEQLIKYKDWIILKTGGWIGSDKLIIGKINRKVWKEYLICHEEIQRQEMWNDSKIKSLYAYCCPEAFIKEINDGIVKVNYKFRVDEKLYNKYDSANIYYKIDKRTGDLTMIKVEQNN